MLKRFKVCLIFSLVLLSAFRLNALTTNWSTFVLSSNLFDASNVLGAPDGIHSRVFDNNGTTVEYITVGGFGTNDNTMYYDTESFVSLLGVDETVFASADFIAFEHNGVAGRSYESSYWEFNDGFNSMTIFHDFYDPQLSESIISLGNIAIRTYAGFFGLDPAFQNRGDMAFILFDIDGSSNLNPLLPTFTATVSAFGSSVSRSDSPDPDALGTFGTVVPEPSTVVLFIFGLAGIIGFLRRSQPGTRTECGARNSSMK